MAALETIRTKFGIGASIIIAFGLLLFLVNPSDIFQTLQSVSSKNNVGKIGKKSVSYTEFQQEVDKLSSLYENSSSEDIQDQLRKEVWQNYIDQNLFIKNAQAAGITVGESELYDLLNGDNVSPLVSSMFQNSEQLQAFLQEKDEDQRSKFLWEYLQSQVVTNQYRNKYNALFAYSNIENAIQVNRSIADNNTTANVEFVMVPFSYAADTTVVVSDKEISEYYDNHKKFFKQEATRDIEYAVFQVVPSTEDLAALNETFTKRYDEFAATDNVRSFLQHNSEVQLSDRWYKAGDLKPVNADLDAFVADNTTGVSPIYNVGNTFIAGRIMASAMIPETVTFRHMAFYNNADGQHLADSLMAVLKSGGDFSSLALEYSLDRSSAADGEFGKVGEVNQNTVPAGFGALFTAKKGEPFLVKAESVLHIVEVTGTSAPVLSKQVAIYQKEATPSETTFNKYYGDANHLATLSAGKYENYRAACDTVGIYSHSLTINEATDTYGTIGHAKEITRWAFDNKPGKVSNIISVDNKYLFVVAVKEAYKEGFAPISVVSDAIKNQLYSEKYAEKYKNDVAEKIAGLTDLEAIAEKLGTTVSSQSDISFSAMSARSLDPKFVGAIASAKEGVVSGPVAGSYGVYVFNVLGRDTGAFYTESDAKNANAQILNYDIQMLQTVMMDDADVKDYRARFF